MPETDAQKVKYHLQEAAKLLKAHPPPEELQNFESTELASRQHIVETVGPVMGEIFFIRGATKGWETSPSDDLYRGRSYPLASSSPPWSQAQQPMESSDGEMWSSCRSHLFLARGGGYPVSDDGVEGGS